MRLYIIILICFYICSCSDTKPNSKELFSIEELELIDSNKDIIKEVFEYRKAVNLNDQSLLFIYAYRAVKLDTTKFRNSHFHFKGWYVDYTNNHEVYDSLLDKHYGIKTIKVNEIEYLKLFGAEEVDSIIFPKDSRKGCFVEFQNLMNAIERKCNYRNDSYAKAYWEEREVSFNRFRNEVKMKSYRKGFQNLDWKQSAYYDCESKNLDNIKFIDPRDGCDGYLLNYCSYQFPEKGLVAFTDTIKSVIKEKVLGKIDTAGLLPMKFNFDSLGNLKSVNSKKIALDEKLFKIFECISGVQQIRFLNRKLVGYSETVDRGDLNYWLSGSRH